MASSSVNGQAWVDRNNRCLRPSSWTETWFSAPEIGFKTWMSGREAVHIPESWLSRLYRLWWLSILPSDAPSMFTTARFTSERFGSRVRPEESCPANMCAVADSAYLTALVAARQGLPESRPTILYCNVQVVDVWTFCSSHNGTYVAQCWDPPAVGRTLQSAWSATPASSMGNMIRKYRWSKTYKPRTYTSVVL
jgi:hypothetical protein